MFPCTQFQHVTIDTFYPRINHFINANIKLSEIALASGGVIKRKNVLCFRFQIAFPNEIICVVDKC